MPAVDHWNADAARKVDRKDKWIHSWNASWRQQRLRKIAGNHLLLFNLCDPPVFGALCTLGAEGSGWTGPTANFLCPSHQVKAEISFAHLCVWFDMCPLQVYVSFNVIINLTPVSQHGARFPVHPELDNIVVPTRNMFNSLSVVTIPNGHLTLIFY